MMQMRRMTKKVMVVVSKNIGFDFEFSSILSTPFCPNILFPAQFECRVLVLYVFQKQKNKRLFSLLSYRSGEPHRGCLGGFGGSDSLCLISLHKGGKGLWWPEGRLSWDTLITQLTSPHPKIAKTQRREDLEQLETDPALHSSLFSDITEPWNC